MVETSAALMSDPSVRPHNKLCMTCACCKMPTRTQDLSHERACRGHECP